MVLCPVQLFLQQPPSQTCCPPAPCVQKHAGDGNERYCHASVRLLQGYCLQQLKHQLPSHCQLTNRLLQSGMSASELIFVALQHSLLSEVADHVLKTSINVRTASSLLWGHGWEQRTRKQAGCAPTQQSAHSIRVTLKNPQLLPVF